MADDVAGSIVGDAENAVEGGVAGESTQGKGFDSFNDAKKFLGSPGEGNQWHHIVEQSQIQKSGFETQLIQNIDCCCNCPLPEIEEIAQDSQFKPISISREEFEAAWNEKVTKRDDKS